MKYVSNTNTPLNRAGAKIPRFPSMTIRFRFVQTWPVSKLCALSLTRLHWVIRATNIVLSNVTRSSMRLRWARLHTLQTTIQVFSPPRQVSATSLWQPIPLRPKKMTEAAEVQVEDLAGVEETLIPRAIRHMFVLSVKQPTRQVKQTRAVAALPRQQWISPALNLQC